MASLEEQVLELLRSTQSTAAQTRVDAELRLNQLHSNEGYSAALVTIGGHTDIGVPDRLAALINLKNFVNTSWSPSLDDYDGKVLIGDETKSSVRSRLLSIIYDAQVDSKVTAATAAVVSKIAKVDFPEEWPGLLESLLGQIPQGSNDQVQGILVVLGELLSDGLDEEQFYQYANSLVASLRDVAMDGNKKLMVRAHAVNIFRSCFDFVENLKDKEEASIKSFTKGVCDAWAQFLLQVLEEPMPQLPSQEEEENTLTSQVSHDWRGVVALKVQVVLTLAKIQTIFPDLMAAQQFFEACWNAIQAHSPPYYTCYVEGDRQGGLINQYQLQYTLDLLVIEEIDYLQTLLEAPLVQEYLNGMREADKASNGNSVGNWITSVLQTLVTFSSITKETVGMWEIDFNVFLSEETFAETNNSPRSVCAGFVWKISNWFPKESLESMLGYIKAIYEDSNSAWRLKEAALFSLQQIAEEFENERRSADTNAIRMCIEYVHPAMTDPQQFLRARGHIAMATVLCAWMESLSPDHGTILSYSHISLNAMDNDESDVVKTACIRIMRDYLTTLPSTEATQLQGPVVDSVAKFLESQDFDDLDHNIDLIDVVMQTLRDAIMANPVTCLDHNALGVLLTMVKYGAARDDHSGILIDEAFESAANAMAKQGGDSYARFCQKVLPSLMAAFDIEDPDTKQKTALTDVAVSVLKILAESAVEPLPQGFVGAAMPRLCRLIFSDVDFFLRQSATLTIKHMLMNDKDQVFGWVDPELHKNGLEMCFLVIGHLLGPEVDDASAAEVGELAVSIVEKADPSALGTSMHELLQIIAIRLSTAEHPSLIQSLTMVFARLSILNASDIIGFLSDLSIPEKNRSTVPHTAQTLISNNQPEDSALKVVIKKWLENASHFVGFDSIRQCVSALVAVYRLHDPRVAAINVNGDLIPDTSSRIKTRSMAKSRPIQYTVVPAPLKIVKVLVAELVPYGDPHTALSVKSPTLKSPDLVSAAGSLNANIAGTTAANGNSDEDWESEDEEEHGSLSWGAGGSKAADDETQRYLVEFFRQEGADPRFQELYGMLSAEEKKRTVDAVDQRTAALGVGN